MVFTKKNMVVKNFLKSDKALKNGKKIYNLGFLVDFFVVVRS